MPWYRTRPSMISSIRRSSASRSASEDHWAERLVAVSVELPRLTFAEHRPFSLVQANQLGQQRRRLGAPSPKSRPARTPSGVPGNTCTNQRPNNTCLCRDGGSAPVFVRRQGQDKQANRKTRNTCLTCLPTIILSVLGTKQGRRAAWLSTCMGCRWSQVQILSPRSKTRWPCDL